MTTLSGVFRGGDAVTGPAIVIDAVGMGRRAAIAIDRYLRDEPFPKEEKKKTIKFKDIPEEKLPKEKKDRKITTKISVKRRRNSFDAFAVGFTRKEAVEEAKKCINWNCAECASYIRKCPMGAIRFRCDLIKTYGYEVNLSRRQSLDSWVIEITAGFFSHFGMFRKRNSLLLRAPGARPEVDFQSQCMRCGLCLEVCPHDALQPSFLESGWEGTLTPRLVFRKGFCDPTCNACGHVYPTIAIPPLSLEVKRTQVIGTAYLDLRRCESCLICRDMCPQRAIEAVKVEKGGEMIRFPHVVPESCIGCGLCDYICPTEGEASIRVFAPIDSINQGKSVKILQ